MKTNAIPMMDFEQLARKNIRKLKPYQSARSLVKGDNYIFLDANENPYGNGLNRYPDPFQQELKAVIGRHKQVDSAYMVLGNGSDEIIDMLVRSFVEPGEDHILVHAPGFSMYAVSAETLGAEVREFRLNEVFQPELDTLRQAVDAHTKLAFFCTPNNPTGNRLDPQVIEQFALEFAGLVVIDEAYIDFSGQTSFLHKIDEIPNIVVLQTFSKAWGMAGARLGMGFMHPRLAAILNKVKFPYNVNKLTIREALQRLEDIPEMQKRVKELVQERKRMEKELQNVHQVVHVYPSDANFLLVKFRDAATVMDFTQKQGIILRDRSTQPGCANAIRITIGTPQENQALLQALKNIDQHKSHS